MHTVYCHYLTASNCCLTSSVGVVHTYCVLPLTYSLDLLFNVKCTFDVKQQVEPVS
jgi:hypothetical protein